MEKSTRIWIIVGIVVVILVVAGLIIGLAGEEAVEVEPKAIDQPVGEVVVEASPTPTPMPTLTVQVALLKAVGTYSGSGTATRKFEEGIFRHTVNAKIGDPAPGKFYEGWLVLPTASGPEFFSTGKLLKNRQSYTVVFSTNQNFMDHIEVVVTEETEALGLDGVPESHVLEGSFK